MLQTQTRDHLNPASADALVPAATPESGKLKDSVTRVSGKLAVKATSVYRLTRLTVTELAANNATRGGYGETTVDITNRKVVAAVLGVAGTAAVVMVATGNMPQLPESYNSLANIAGDTGLMDDARLRTHRNTLERTAADEATVNDGSAVRAEAMGADIHLQVMDASAISSEADHQPMTPPNTDIRHELQ